MALKKTILAGFITATLLLGSAPLQQAKAFAILEIIKAAIVKVIKAVDLAIQRAQNQTIKLQNLQKEIENTMSKLKLKEIAEWGEKQRELFKTYYDELWKVKTTIAYYKRIKDITANQVRIVEEYKRAYGLIKQDKHFRPNELLYIYDVYTGILEESVKNIDQLMLVVNSFTTQMSDAKRLELIAKADEDIQHNLSSLRRFTNQNIMLSIERSRDEQEQQIMKSYYGIE